MYNNLAPSEYYYGIVEDQTFGGPALVITPKKYFDEEGHWYDNHFKFPFEDVLTAGCSEESVYEVFEGWDIAKIRAEFDSRGFIYNKNLEFDMSYVEG